MRCSGATSLCGVSVCSTLLLFCFSNTNNDDILVGASASAAADLVAFITPHRLRENTYREWNKGSRRWIRTSILRSGNNRHDFFYNDDGDDNGRAARNASHGKNLQGQDRRSVLASAAWPMAAAAAVIAMPLPSLATLDAPGDVEASAAASGSYQSSLATFFPSSFTASTISEKVVATLVQHQFTSNNSLLLTSLCSDENNEAPKTLVNELRTKLYGVGTGIGMRRLGALAGLPLYAKSSLDQTFSRDSLSKKNKILIVYGPHIGIGSADGVVGKKGTGSCGSMLGAYSELRQQMELERLIAQGKISPSRLSANGTDDVLSLVQTPGPRRDILREVQEDRIQEELLNRLTEEELTDKNQNKVVVRVVERTYELIDEMLRSELDSAIKRSVPWDNGRGGNVEIMLLGGIILRRESSGSEDFFRPLAFDSITLSDGESPTITTENLLPTLLDINIDNVMTKLLEEEIELKRLEEEAVRLEQEAEFLRLEAEVAEKERSEYEEMHQSENEETQRPENEAQGRLVFEEMRRSENEEVAKNRVGESGVAAASLFAVSIGGIVAATSVSRDEDSVAISSASKDPRPDPPSKPPPIPTDPVTKKPPPVDPSREDAPAASFLPGLSLLKSQEATNPLDDDYLSTSSERYQNNFAPSYIDKLNEACDAEEAAAAVDDCAPAVKNYFDALSKGEEEPAAEGSAAISNYLDALSGQNDRRDRARVIFPSASGPAVESYLAKLATGEVRSPPSSGVSAYLDAMSSGAAGRPQSAEEINALIYEILETMRGPKLLAQADAAADDSGEPAQTNTKDNAPAVPEYANARDEGTNELSSEAPQVIGGSGSDEIFASNEEACEKTRQPSPSIQAWPSYLNEISFGSVDRQPRLGEFTYLDGLSSGETAATSSRAGTPCVGPYFGYLDSLSSVAESTNERPRSYAKAICEECAKANDESCIAAISNYLDYVALMGPSVRDHEADAALIGFFERATNSLCGNAVREYVGQVASSGKAPSAASMVLYMNALADGRIKPPESDDIDQSQQVGE